MPNSIKEAQRLRRVGPGEYWETARENLGSLGELNPTAIIELRWDCDFDFISINCQALLPSTLFTSRHYYWFRFGLTSPFHFCCFVIYSWRSMFPSYYCIILGPQNSSRFVTWPILSSCVLKGAHHATIDLLACPCRWPKVKACFFLLNSQSLTSCMSEHISRDLNYIVGRF